MIRKISYFILYLAFSLFFLLGMITLQTRLLIFGIYIGFNLLIATIVVRTEK